MKVKYTRTIVIEGEKEWVDKTIQDSLVDEDSPRWVCKYGKISILKLDYEEVPE